MKAGAPFNCSNCNGRLTWQDTPVIECEYCHHRILMKPATQAAGQGRTSSGKINKAALIIGAAVVGGIVMIAMRAVAGA